MSRMGSKSAPFSVYQVDVYRKQSLDVAMLGGEIVIFYI